MTHACCLILSQISRTSNLLRWLLYISKLKTKTYLHIIIKCLCIQNCLLLLRIFHILSKYFWRHLLLLLSIASAFEILTRRPLKLRLLYLILFGKSFSKKKVYKTDLIVKKFIILHYYYYCFITNYNYNPSWKTLNRNKTVW